MEVKTVKLVHQENGVYQCNHYGKCDCTYICHSCPYMQAMMEKVALVEELESEVIKENGDKEVPYE